MNLSTDSHSAIEERFPFQCQTRWPWTDVVDWCNLHVGEFNKDWYRYGTDIMSGVSGWEPNDTYRFRSEQAAVLFRLRWS